MKHYAGLDLSIGSTQVCIVDEDGTKAASVKVESAPDKIACTLDRVGDIERAVIESGRMSPAMCHGLRALGVPVVCIDARQAQPGWRISSGQASTRRCMSNLRPPMACVASSRRAVISSKPGCGSTT